MTKLVNKTARKDQQRPSVGRVIEIANITYLLNSNTSSIARVANINYQQDTSSQQKVCCISIVNSDSSGRGKMISYGEIHNSEDHYELSIRSSSHRITLI